METRRSRVGLMCALACSLGILLAATGADGQPPPSGASPGDDAWQRQQPTRERARELMERQGVAASPEERRRELRTLNEIHRELMLPGTTVPAPHLAPPPRTRTGAD